MVNAYGIPRTIGLTYELNDCNTLGFYYQSKMDFTFPDAIRIGSNFQDVKVGQPNTLGLGVANRSLMDGNLLLAADVYYKLWDDAYLWQDVLLHQWAIALGAQYTAGLTKYRVGYSLQQRSDQSQCRQPVGRHRRILQFRRAVVPGGERGAW